MASSKVTGLGDAVDRLVGDGCGLLAVGGMHLHNHPMAVVREIIRQRRRIHRLLTSPAASLAPDLLLGAGLVEEVFVSYIGFEQLGLAPGFRRAVESGQTRALEFDEAAVVHGLHAGAGGLGFSPLPPGFELSDVHRANPESFRLVENPFTGSQQVAVSALRPDVAIVHAAAADPDGNARLAGAEFTDRLMALAATSVIVQVERVVTTDELLAEGDAGLLPGFLVTAVVEAPGGCLPTAAHGSYDYDLAGLRHYLGQARTAEGFAAYLEEPVPAMAR